MVGIVSKVFLICSSHFVVFLFLMLFRVPVYKYFYSFTTLVTKLIEISYYCVIISIAWSLEVVCLIPKDIGG